MMKIWWKNILALYRHRNFRVGHFILLHPVDVALSQLGMVVRLTNVLVF